MLDAGFRLPVIDYATQTKERTYIERFKALTMHRWFSRKVQTLDLSNIVHQAEALRTRYLADFWRILESPNPASNFERKLRIQRLRLLSSRLAHLAPRTALGALSDALRDQPELRVFAELFKAVNTRDASQIAKLGTNAVQAAGQLLRVEPGPVVFNPDPVADTTIDGLGLAYLLMNGLDVDTRGRALNSADLVRFARGDMKELMGPKSQPLIRELACLHGTRGEAGHPAMLSSAFDDGQSLSFDTDTLMNPSS